MKGTNKCFIVILALLAMVLLSALDSILTPFLVGILLAYLVDPLVNQLMRLRLPRLLSVITVFLLLFGLLTLAALLLIPLIEKQLAVLVVVLPNILTWLQNTIVPWITLHFGVDASTMDINTLKSTLADNWTKAGGIVTVVWKTMLHSGFALIEGLIKFLMVPVVTFYLLCDWKKLLHGIGQLLPRRIEPIVVMLAKECDAVLGAFFRGQLLVMLVLGIIYSVGLTWVGLQIGIMIGIVAGIACIVPYLGLITGITLASIAAMVQFGSISSVLQVLLVFGIGQLTESLFLTPNLVGDRIGLHPVAVIFSVLAGGKLFGFLGVLLALPTAAVIMVLLRYLLGRYRNSQLYQSKGGV